MAGRETEGMKGQNKGRRVVSGGGVSEVMCSILLLMSLLLVVRRGVKRSAYSWMMAGDGCVDGDDGTVQYSRSLCIYVSMYLYPLSPIPNPHLPSY